MRGWVHLHYCTGSGRRRSLSGNPWPVPRCSSLSDFPRCEFSGLEIRAGPRLSFVRYYLSCLCLCRNMWAAIVLGLLSALMILFSFLGILLMMVTKGQLLNGSGCLKVHKYIAYQIMYHIVWYWDQSWYGESCPRVWCICSRSRLSRSLRSQWRVTHHSIEARIGFTDPFTFHIIFSYIPHLA